MPPFFRGGGMRPGWQEVLHRPELDCWLQAIPLRGRWHCSINTLSHAITLHRRSGQHQTHFTDSQTSRRTPDATRHRHQARTADAHHQPDPKPARLNCPHQLSLRSGNFHRSGKLPLKRAVESATQKVRRPCVFARVFCLASCMC